MEGNPIYELSYTENGGVLIQNGKDVALASKGLVSVYKDGSKLKLDRDFFIKECPVCDFGAFDGILSYCPECNTLEMIAYPKMTVQELYRPDLSCNDDPRREFDDYTDEEWNFLKGWND